MIQFKAQGLAIPLQKTLQPLDNPFGHEVVTYVLGTICHPCVRAGQIVLLARSEGFEPPTPRFEVWCSIQLSYERTGVS